MINYFTRIFLLVLFVFAFKDDLVSQEITKKIEYFYNSQQISERYFVIENLEGLKHGAYESYYRIPEINFRKQGKTDSERLKSIGNLEYGYRVGIWITYDKPKKINNVYTLGNILSKGEYFYGHKFGIWQEIDSSGNFVSRDYKLRIKKDSSTPELDYPKPAANNNISGTVVIGYKMDKECMLDEIRFHSNLGFGLEKEALDCILSYPMVFPCKDTMIIDSIRFEIQ